MSTNLYRRNVLLVELSDGIPKYDSLEKINITSSESKGKSERPGKGLITSLGFKTKARSLKIKKKKARYAIGKFNEKDISKIIKKFEKN